MSSPGSAKWSGDNTLGHVLVHERVRLRGPEFRVRYCNGDEVSYVMIVYEARSTAGEPEPDAEETTAVRYVAPEELENLDVADRLKVILRR